jgi:drug/metabolite transporter (DMT)-like permease
MKPTSGALLLALAAIVTGQVAYHLAARGSTRLASPVLLVAVAYVVSLTVVLVLASVTHQLRFSSATRPLLVRGAILGAAVAAVELGYVYAYRHGLPLGTGALGVLTLTTVVLAPLGVVLLHEHLSWRVLLGVVLAVSGVWLMRS